MLVTTQHWFGIMCRTSAISSRDPKLARATMDHLLAATFGYFEHELAGSLKKGKLPA